MAAWLSLSLNLRLRLSLCLRLGLLSLILQSRLYLDLMNVRLHLLSRETQLLAFR